MARAGELSRSSFVLPLTVGLVALAVYFRTLLPGLAFGDWGEMQTVPHVLGVAHPTGYPTYIILGWLAHLVPIGSIAFRANLLSAVLVASALGVTVAILLRLGTRPAIAGGAALLLGAVGTVWAAATVAEVNPLHLLFVALLLHRALVWEEDRRPRDLIIGAALLGLAVGNHLLILFVAPFVVLFVLWVGRREIAADPRILVGAVAAGLDLGERLSVHPDRGGSGPAAAVQPSRHPRRGPVARQRSPVPRSVRVPLGQRAVRVRRARCPRCGGSSLIAGRRCCRSSAASAWRCWSASGRRSG